MCSQSILRCRESLLVYLLVNLALSSLNSNFIEDRHYETPVSSFYIPNIEKSVWGKTGSQFV